MPNANRSRSGSLAPLVVLGAGLLLVVAAAVLLLPRSNSPAAPEAAGIPTEDSFPEISRVSLADAKAAFDNQTAVFVDVRGAEDYAASHIPGAVSIPLSELGTRLNELSPSEWIITYCT